MIISLIRKPGEQVSPPESYTLLITGVTPDGNGVISLEFRPKPSVFSTASVNGIEVLKP